MRPLLHSLAALAAFLLAARGVRAVVPWPEDLGLRAKLEHLRLHADEYDVLFVGSSRVFRGIVPAELDAALAERGIEVRSFNLGVGGMEAFESDRVLRFVLDLEPARLRLVVLESGRLDPLDDEQETTTTARVVAWHDVSGTRDVLEALAAADVEPRVRRTEVARHLRLFALWATSLGRGPDIAAVARGLPPAVPDPRIQSPEELARNRGWQAFPDDDARPDSAKWERFVQRATRSESRGANPTEASLSRFPAGVVRRQVARVTARVPSLAYLTLPTSEGNVFARVLGTLGVYPAHLAYDRPSRYPALYDRELRVDANHLTRRGASLLTALVARDVERLWRGGE